MQLIHYEILLPHPPCMTTCIVIVHNTLHSILLGFLLLFYVCIYLHIFLKDEIWVHGLNQIPFQCESWSENRICLFSTSHSNLGVQSHCDGEGQLPELGCTGATSHRPADHWTAALEHGHLWRGNSFTAQHDLWLYLINGLRNEDENYWQPSTFHRPTTRSTERIMVSTNRVQCDWETQSLASFVRLWGVDIVPDLKPKQTLINHPHWGVTWIYYNI